MASLETYKVYLITGGEALKIVNDYFKRAQERNEEILRLTHQYGIARIYTSGYFAGIEGDKNPDHKIFRKGDKGFWIFRRNTRKGRELSDAINNATAKALKRKVDIAFVKEGECRAFRKRTDGGQGQWMMSSQFFGSDPYFFIIPEECKDVKLVSGLRQLKLSDYYRMIEDKEQSKEKIDG